MDQCLTTVATGLQFHRANLNNVPNSSGNARESGAWMGLWGNIELMGGKKKTTLGAGGERLKRKINVQMYL